MMKKYLSGFVALSLSLVTLTALGQDIQWVKGITWEQVKARAKAQHKPIFVDVMATWCAPCKKMEDEVYTQQPIYSLVNKQFIAVKIQVDTTDADGTDVKAWYGTAASLGLRYNVNAYPAYLFFSEEGDLIFRDGGAKKTEKFKDILDATLRDGVSYGKQLVAWKNGTLDPLDIPGMVRHASIIRDAATVRQLGRSGIQYLSTQTGTKLYDAEYISAVADHLESADEKLFRLFYPEANGLRTDSLLNRKGLSAAITNIVINRDIRAALIKNDDWRQPVANKPDWKRIRKTLTKKYEAKTVAKLLAVNQRNWYGLSRPDVNEWARLTIAYHEQYTDWEKLSSTVGTIINNDMYNGVFQRVTDKKILLAAAVLQKKVVDAAFQKDSLESAGEVDTYANLLYKSGKVQEAIAWQQKAVSYRQQMEVRRGDRKAGYSVTLGEILDKMRQGQPTWNN